MNGSRQPSHLTNRETGKSGLAHPEIQRVRPIMLPIAANESKPCARGHSLRGGLSRLLIQPCCLLPIQPNKAVDAHSDQSRGHPGSDKHPDHLISLPPAYAAEPLPPGR